MTFTCKFSPCFFVIFLFIFADTVFNEAIQWEDYDGRHLKPNTKEFYRYSWDSYIPIPRRHSLPKSSTFDIYVRKFSPTRERTRRHLWLISGGPGSSTSGIERALTVKMADTTIYIMDNRGLGHSHKYNIHNFSVIKLIFCSLDFAIILKVQNVTVIRRNATNLSIIPRKTFQCMRLPRITITLVE